MGKRKKTKVKETQKESKMDAMDTEQEVSTTSESADINTVNEYEETQDLHEQEELQESQQEEQQEDTSTIGFLLRSGREEKQLSLKVVSKNTKISLTNLEFLERDLLDRLPDKAYVAGYVKSYSKILGLNHLECLDRLEYTYNLISPPQPTFEETVKTSNKEIVQKDMLVRVAVAVVAIFALVAIVSLFNSKKDEIAKMDEQTKAPITALKVNAKTPLQNELSVAKTEVKADATPQDGKALETPVVVETKPAPTPEAARVSELKVIPTPAKKIVVEAKVVEVVKPTEEKKVEKEIKEVKKENKKFWPMNQELYSIDSTLSEDKINSLVPSNFKNAVISGQQNVFVKAVKGDTWLTYKTDDKAIRKFVLKKGKGILIRGTETRLFLGNVGVVKIFLNNKPLQVSSRTGVKSLVFPQENRSKYVMPLFIYHKTGKVETSDDYIKRKDIEL